MKTNVYICENPFQIMVAIILRGQEQETSDSDIIITDRAPGMENYADNLRKLKIFRKVHFITNKHCHNRKKKIHYMWRHTKCEFRGCYLEETKRFSFDYTDIYSMNVTCMTNFICHKMQTRKVFPDIHLYEEGFGCYTDHYYHHLFNSNLCRGIVVRLANFMFKREKPISLVTELLLFEPRLIRWEPPFKVNGIGKLDILSDDILKAQLNQVFHYEGEADEYQQLVIFFEDCVYQDSGDDRDFGIIKQLADYVGRDNFLLKLHPRTEYNRFTIEKIKTVKRQGLPWEMIAMNMAHDEKHVFVTITSSSVITYSLLFEKNYCSVLLFKCVPEFAKNVNPDILNFLEEYAAAKPDTVFIPESIEEAFMIINNYRKKGVLV